MADDATATLVPALRVYVRRARVARIVAIVSGIFIVYNVVGFGPAASLSSIALPAALVVGGLAVRFGLSRALRPVAAEAGVDAALLGRLLRDPYLPGAIESDDGGAGLRKLIDKRRA